MQRAKAFFYLCAGVFLLVLSYHLGAQQAQAQAQSQAKTQTQPQGNRTVAGMGMNPLTVVTTNGDVYMQLSYMEGDQDMVKTVFLGNMWDAYPNGHPRGKVTR